MATTESVEHNRLIRVDAPRLGHLPVFDGIRGLLLPVVVFYHAQLMPFLQGGPIIIDLFFVLSGFLICSLLLDEKNRFGEIGLRNFYTRRVLRLFPAMYALIALFSLFSVVVILLGLDKNGSLSTWWVDALGAGFYVYNIVAAAFPNEVTGAIGQTWSLAVEEQFYFVWPLLLVWVLRRKSRSTDMRLIVGSVVFMAVFFFIRFHFQYIADFTGSEMEFTDMESPTWQGFLYRLASSRPDMIVYGCLLAFVARHIPRPVPETLRRWLSVIAPLSWIWFTLVMFLGNTGSPFFELYGGPAYQIGLLCLGVMTMDLFFRQESWYAQAIAWHPLRWFGLRTYGIYLWHVVPLWFLLPVLNSTFGPAKIVVGVVASAIGFALGLLSFELIEKRFLKLKDRFSGKQEPRKPRTAPQPTPGSDAPAANGTGNNGIGTNSSGTNGAGTNGAGTIDLTGADRDTGAPGEAAVTDGTETPRVQTDGTETRGVPGGQT